MLLLLLLPVLRPEVIRNIQSINALTAGQANACATVSEASLLQANHVGGPCRPALHAAREACNLNCVAQFQLSARMLEPVVEQLVRADLGR
jgi:hypothetical protein